MSPIAQGVGIAVLAWAAWCLSNLLIMLLVRPTGPSCTGGRVYVPVSLRNVLNDEQFAAVRWHEEGHKHHRHTWKNFAYVCFFMTPSESRLYQQEMEADKYAAEHGHAAALAQALRRLSAHPQDLHRAEILEDGAWY